ncbi:unnamed protein product [Effrenium voratum]|uniref:Helix-hairpin-helix domain-containing protein n=1 Tax=Effrenium voratum TaxID=2562239 RepID=A0AA36MUJ6_9DINO|nr:unnamed protein product [Effrenium voratum]
MVFVRWQNNVILVIQWEHFWYSLAWLLFLQLWFLLLWRWSLAIIAALLLMKRTWDLRPAVAPLAPELRTEPLEAPWRRRAAQRRHTTESSLGEPPDLVIWEAERRFMFGGFSADYLIDGFDQPQWVDGYGHECGGPQAIIFLGGQRFRYQWKVVVNADTDENGWQYAFAFTQDAQWRHTMDTVQTWVRRRQHHGRCLLGSEPAESETFAFDASPEAKAVESSLTENDQLNQYIRLYLSIRNDVDFVLGILEKHKMNLLTWKDRQVSTIVTWLLAAILLICCLVPTRVIFAGIIGFTFYIGSLMGHRKRGHRRDFLRELAKLSNSKREYHGRENWSVLEENGVTRLLLRDWCNASYKTQFNLKNLGAVGRPGGAGLPTHPAAQALQILALGDVYGNFLDHVPSDSTDYDTSCICYKLHGPLPEAERPIMDLASPQRHRDEPRVPATAPLGLTEAAQSLSRRRSATPTARVAKATTPQVAAAVVETLNTHSIEQLYTIPGIGPVSANKILIKRRGGGFGDLADVFQTLGNPVGTKIVRSLAQ